MGRPRTILPVTDEELHRLYHDEGLSISRIASMFGAGCEGVRQDMMRRGIQRRISGACPGHLNRAWKGGRILDKTGYVLRHVPDHPHANSGGYVREHRLVMEKALGCYLEQNEVVHHVDGNRQNNSPENLELYGCNADHLRDELTGRVPNWTPEGKEQILRACRTAPQPEWTDERRQKAKERMLARWENGGIRRHKWTDEEREKQRQVMKARCRNHRGQMVEKPKPDGPQAEAVQPPSSLQSQRTCASASPSSLRRCRTRRAASLHIPSRTQWMPRLRQHLHSH